MGVFSGFGSDASALDLSVANAAPEINAAVVIMAIVQSGTILTIFNVINLSCCTKSPYNWK